MVKQWLHIADDGKHSYYETEDEARAIPGGRVYKTDRIDHTSTLEEATGWAARYFRMFWGRNAPAIFADDPDFKDDVLFMGALKAQHAYYETIERYAAALLEDLQTKEHRVQMQEMQKEHDAQKARIDASLARRPRGMPWK